MFQTCERAFTVEFLAFQNRHLSGAHFIPDIKLPWPVVKLNMNYLLVSSTGRTLFLWSRLPFYQFLLSSFGKTRQFWIFEYEFFFFLINFYFLFLLKIQQTTKHKNFLYIRKIKRKSNPQPKTESLPNLHLAVPRQHINLKSTYFWASFWSNCTVSETGKGWMAL